MISFILQYWKKLLYFLITGSTSLFIAACYGMPAGFSDLGSWTVKTRDKENKPIEGLEVTVLQYAGDAQVPVTADLAQTDSTGTAVLYMAIYDKNVDYRHEAVIRDIDGEENGGLFADTTVIKGGPDTSNVTIHPAK